MIVSCPQCESRYRIRDEKLSGARARITCRNCGHKFIVEKESAHSLPVTLRSETPSKPSEDDENEVPTTLMPHGSAVVRKIRETTQDAPFPIPIAGDPGQDPLIPRRDPASPRPRAQVRPAGAPTDAEIEARRDQMMLAGIVVCVILLLLLGVALRFV